MAKPNPIELRVQKLSAQWGEFSEEADARLLVWQIQTDEARMVEAFVALENESGAGQHADLFHAFDAPFVHAQSYASGLREEFVTLYREIKDALTPEGVAADWEPPAQDEDEHDISHLIRTLLAFNAHYALPGAFALLLRPSAVADPSGYLSWLQQFTIAAPSAVRALVIDQVAAPGYAPLIAADPQRVMVKRADLDMPGALAEISQAAGQLDTPGGQFRDLFVKLGNALGKQDVALALSLGEPLLTIATVQGWFHMAVPVHFALAAALAGAGRLDEASSSYLAAELSAATGETAGAEMTRPTCKQLRMQARLGRGSVLVTQSAWLSAAQLYDETAPLALELGDLRGTLDCHRLASFCYEQNGQADRAWDAGLAGMNVARAMDEETRKTSTFGYLGEAMLRLCKSGPRRALATRTEREISEIAGTREWRPASLAPPVAGVA